MAVEEGPFQLVSIDLIIDLSKSDGYDSILTIVNQECTKAAKFIPCNKTINRPECRQVPETPCALVQPPKKDYI